MSNGRDSDRPRELIKNGHDIIQDREIKVLYETINKLEDTFSHNYDRISTSFETFRMENEQAHSAMRSALASSASVNNILRALALVFITSLGGLLGYGFGEIDDIKSDVRTIDSRTSADWANGRKWGEVLDRDMARLYESVRELDKKVESKQSRNVKPNKGDN